MVEPSDPSAQIHYGTSGGDHASLREAAREAREQFGLRALARGAGLSAHAVSGFVAGAGETNDATIAALEAVLPRLASVRAETEERLATVLERVWQQCRDEGVTGFARRAGVDRGTLSAVLTGRRSPSGRMLMRLREAVREDCGADQQ